jgi:hypothetical protein
MEAVEFDLQEFRKSSFSPPSNGGCLEVAAKAGVVGVRDSKDPGGPILHFSAKEWHAFVDGVKAGEFDL